MAAHTYVENDVLHQTGIELVCVLYSEALTRVSRAIDSFEPGSEIDRAAAIGGAMAVVVELQGSLNLEAGEEIAKDLARLYDYVQDRLINGHANQDPALLQEAHSVLETLFEGWQDCRTALHQTEPTVPREEPVAAGDQRAWTL